LKHLEVKIKPKIYFKSITLNQNIVVFKLPLNIATKLSPQVVNGTPDLLMLKLLSFFEYITN